MSSRDVERSFYAMMSKYRMWCHCHLVEQADRRVDFDTLCDYISIMAQEVLDEKWLK